MPSLQQKLIELAKSPQAKKLADKAQAFANDPKTKEQIEKAKRKVADMRDGGKKSAPPDGPKAA